MGFSGLAFAGKKFVPPAWSQKLPAGERFVLVLDDAAVLDMETGLVWERSPGTTTMNWSLAQFHCYRREVGGCKGWRLPTIEELSSLIDPTQSNPALPAGHPFLVQPALYWSATTAADDTSSAWVVNFIDGDGGNNAKSSNNGRVWCV